MNAPTNHSKLLAWVDEISKMTQPDSSFGAMDTKAEYDALIKMQWQAGWLLRLPNARIHICFDRILPM